MKKLTGFQSAYLLRDLPLDKKYQQFYSGAGFLHCPEIITQGTEDIRTVEIRVQQHDRNLLRGIAYILIVRGFGFYKI